MGWSSLLVPALVLALILYVPGILVNALLFRSCAHYCFCTTDWCSGIGCCFTSFWV